MNAKDHEMLVAILKHVDEKYDDPDEAKHVPYKVFTDMLARGFALSDKQRQWVKGVHARLFDEPEYENLISSGKAPRGREVPTPKVLQNLPMKPPVRRERKPQ